MKNITKIQNGNTGHRTYRTIFLPYGNKHRKKLLSVSYVHSPISDESVGHV